MANEIGRATPAQVNLSDVMEHLAIAFGGIYEKLTERDLEVAKLRLHLNEQKTMIDCLSNRIEGMHRSLSERIAVLEVPKAPGNDDPLAVAAELTAMLERVERALTESDER